MGVYDILSNGEQVKCWKCEMKQLDIDSMVGKLDENEDYIVLLRSGGYVEVKDEKIIKIFEENYTFDFFSHVFDKWGNKIFTESDLEGLVLEGLVSGEKYYYE